MGETHPLTSRFSELYRGIPTLAKCLMLSDKKAKALDRLSYAMQNID